MNGGRGGKEGGRDASESLSVSENGSGGNMSSGLAFRRWEIGGGGGGRFIPVTSESEWAKGRLLMLGRGVCSDRTWGTDGVEAFL